MIDMIILICGLPRAGKTTYSKQYEGKCKIYHLDDYGGPVNSYVYLNKKINPNEDILIEGVYNRTEQRKNLILPYKNDNKICIWLDTSTEVKRTRHGYGKHCEYSFEPPTYDEGWDEIYIIKDNKEKYLLPKKETINV